MQDVVTLDEQLVKSARPRGTMLSVCPVPGCTTLTMGGTCVAHDPPVTVIFERGRPYVAETVDDLEPLGLGG
jgi:hypothetical protein